MGTGRETCCPLGAPLTPLVRPMSLLQQRTHGPHPLRGSATVSEQRTELHSSHRHTGVSSKPLKRKDLCQLVSTNSRGLGSGRPETLETLMRWATARLAGAGIAAPRLDAEILLRHTLRIDRARFFLRLPEPVAADVTLAFTALIDRRVAGEPITYITGTREFMGLPFIVTPDVLIPRPETELLVEWALSTIGDGARVTVADLGTGSGAIAISIAALAPPTAAVSVTGTDISEAALAVARENLARIAPPHPVTFLQGSLAQPIQAQVDLVLANLPYLTPAQIAGNHDLDAEPRVALDGGAHGLELVNELIRDLPRLLKRGGAAGFELDPDQCYTVRSALADAFPNYEIQIITDLSGRERHVVMRRS